MTYTTAEPLLILPQPQDGIDLQGQPPVPENGMLHINHSWNMMFHDVFPYFPHEISFNLIMFHPHSPSFPHLFIIENPRIFP